MALIMRDSVNASAIPADTPVVAGYGDGVYAWSPSDWARFSNAITLSIVVSAPDQGDILDVETGNATPQDVPGWIDRFNRPGRRRPTIYCNRSTIGAVTQAAAGRPFDWWAATLDGTQSVPGAVAVQYVDVGSAYDESIIWDVTWAGLPAPAPILEDVTMGAISFRPGGPNDRYDRVAVRSGHLVRWWGDSISGMASGVNADGSSIGYADEGAPGGVTFLPQSAFCSWQHDGTFVTFGAIGQDGNMYAIWGDINTGNRSGWYQVHDSQEDPPRPGPQGPPGPPGPTYDDTAVKAELARHEQDLQAIKAAIQ